MTIIKPIVAWFAAALTTSVLASITSSQYVMHGLSQIGASISLSQRLAMTWADLAILQALMPITMACFLIGFLTAFAGHHFLTGQRVLWNVAAGFASLVCTLILMSWVLNLMPVAGARSTSGLLLIGVCGALGGLIFTKINQAKRGTAA